VNIWCPICDKIMKSPVETICKHSFCESCALNHYSKHKGCFICKVPTKGVFNTNKFLEGKIRDVSKEAYMNFDKKGGKLEKIDENEGEEEEDDIEKISKEYSKQ
jgi:hypothetical protein